MGHNSQVAEHCYTEALEVEHCCIEVVVEHYCTEVVAAELKKGPHLPQVLESQGPPVDLVAKKVERAFEDSE